MRFGYWRGVTLAVALISAMATARTASADGFHDTIPREVPAMDLNTGQPYYAPPIPWGHYAKDGFGDHFGKSCGICGRLLGHCGGGLGGLHHGGKGGCGGAGCGLFHHGGKGGCGDPGCGLGHGRRVKDCGLCKGKGCGFCTSSGAGDPIHALASSQAPAPAMSPQAGPVPSSQACTEPGCHLGKGHHHGDPSWGDPCGSCGGRGCGLCGGLGRLFHHGSACDNCGGRGCGKCGRGGCGFCGGKGCGHCGGLKGKLSGLLHPHRGEIKYFVGPGGPVPLTPGYVPWVNPVRSPRDFLAFPPYTPDGL